MRTELNLTASLPRIRCATLLVHGDHDPIVPLRKVNPLFVQIPHRQIEIYTNTGHTPSLERSHHFNQTALQFLLA
jgi:pimeloyl-ACP methyl ester carboxylesterase